MKRQCHNSRKREEADEARAEKRLSRRPLLRDVAITGEYAPTALRAKRLDPFHIRQIAATKLVFDVLDEVPAFEQRTEPASQDRWQIVVDQ